MSKHIRNSEGELYSFMPSGFVLLAWGEKLFLLLRTKDYVAHKINT